MTIEQIIEYIDEELSLPIGNRAVNAEIEADKLYKLFLRRLKEKLLKK